MCLTIAISTAGDAGIGSMLALREIGGALILGTLIGVPAAFLTGRIDEGEPLQIEVLAIAFLTVGFAVWFEVSFLLSAMVSGAIIAILARHHTRAFHEIEHIQWPFMLVFFILAGAALDAGSVAQMGFVGAAYIVLRVGSRLVGGWLGASLAGTPRKERHLFGIALLPQAGVAIGMALLGAQALPQWEEQIISLTIAATVFFESVGPLATMWALQRTV